MLSNEGYWKMKGCEAVCEGWGWLKMRVMIEFQFLVALYILQSHIVVLSSSLRLGPTSLTVGVLAVIHIFLFQAYTYTLLPSRREAEKRSFLNQGLAAAKAYIHS